MHGYFRVESLFHWVLYTMLVHLLCACAGYRTNKVQREKNRTREPTKSPRIIRMPFVSSYKFYYYLAFYTEFQY